MEDAVRSGRGYSLSGRRGRDIDLDKLRHRIKWACRRVAEVVEDDDAVALGEQSLNRMDPDESSSTGDNDGPPETLTLDHDEPLYPQAMLGAPSLSGASRRRIRRAALISTITLGVLLIAWRRLGASAQLAPVNVTPLPVALALVGSGLFLVGRAWRFRLLLGGRVAFAQLLATVGVSWGAGLLLPGPSADATFIVLARGRLGIGARRGTSVSVLARLLDVISLAIVVVVAATVSSADEPSGPIIATAIVGGIVLVTLTLCLHGRGRHLLIRILSQWRRTKPLAGSVDDALAELGRPRRVVMLLLSTAFCRLATLLQYAALFAILGLDVDVWGVWFVLAVRTILSTIPIQGLAGLGTGQIWWTSALVLEGVAAGSAVGISITLSLLDLAVSCPLVLACWVLSRAIQQRLPKTVAGDAAVHPLSRALVDVPQEIDVPS
jgi:hypothetical protein